MRKPSGIDIVTRLYDLADLPHLGRLVFSIMGQADAPPLRLHVMLQRFSFIEVQSAREATRELRRLHNRASVMMHNWDNPAPFDLRVPLLNWGLEVAQGRYVTCFDIQDQLRPHACSALLARLRCTEAALALGGTAFQPVIWWGDVMLPISDQASGPASTPIFMVDRQRLAVENLVFRSNEPDAEIQELIQRLGKRYAVDTVCQNDMLAMRLRPL